MKQFGSKNAGTWQSELQRALQNKIDPKWNHEEIVTMNVRDIKERNRITYTHIYAHAILPVEFTEDSV